MKNISYFLILLIVSIPALASAHVKWFVNSESVLAQSQGFTSFYGWGSKEVLIWSTIVLIVVFIFSLIDRYTRTPKGLLSFGLNHEKVINRVSQVILGLFLVTVSFIWKIIIIPEMHVVDSVTIVLQYIQVAIGFMYIFNFKPRLASIILATFCISLILSLIHI